MAESIDEALSRLRAEFPARFAQAETEQVLREENAKLLGKSGQLTALLKQLGKAAPEQRRELGQKVNQLKQEVEQGFEARLSALAGQKRSAELNARPFDLTLPGRVPAQLGHKHPISLVREEVIEIFRGLGFAVHDGPDIEHEANNFSKLGFPPDHPA